jgi:hypothetical protein
MAEIFGIDLNTLVNMLMVLGTFLMVVITYKSVKSSNNQLKLLEKQTHLLLQKQKPSLCIPAPPFFHENSVNLEITNKGDDIAYDVGAVSHFFQMEYVPLKESTDPIIKFKFSEIYQDLFKDYEGNDCNLKSKFGYYTSFEDRSLLIEKFWEDPSSLLEKISSFLNPKKMEKVYPTNLIIFIKNNNTKIQTIRPGETVHCSITPNFGISTSKKWDHTILSNDSHWAMESFDEIKEILLKNNVNAIGIGLDLCCKDRLENVEYFQEIFAVIFDFRRHRSLKDALDEGITYNRTMNTDQFFSKAGMIHYEMYKNMKKM